MQWRTRAHTEVYLHREKVLLVELGEVEHLTKQCWWRKGFLGAVASQVPAGQVGKVSQWDPEAEACSLRADRKEMLAKPSRVLLRRDWLLWAFRASVEMTWVQEASSDYSS